MCCLSMISWLKKRKNLITDKHRKNLTFRWESNFTTLLVLRGYGNSMASRVEYTDIPFLVHFICSCHVLKCGGAVAVLSRILIKRYFHYNRWSTDWVKRLINYEISPVSQHYFIIGRFETLRQNPLATFKFLALAKTHYMKNVLTETD